MNQQHDTGLSQCESRIGYFFRDKEILRCALTHASGAESRLQSNERLEFLGDAILGAVVCEMLYHRFPDMLEGDLTQIKSSVVSRQTCARISMALDLEGCIIVGRGIASSEGIPSSLLSNVFESLVAAVFLDGGMEVVRQFIVRHIESEIELAASGRGEHDYKSLLQQKVQRDRGITPTYTVIEEKGPDHSKHFLVAAQIDAQQFEPSWGRNKKEAEQRAASNALSALENQDSTDDVAGKE